MKIALLLCGQPRKALESYEKIKKNILDVNNVDVFIHSWFDKNNLYMEKGEKERGDEHYLKPNLDKKLIELYKPKNYIFEPQRFNNFNNFNKNYFNAPDKYVNNYLNCGKNKDFSFEEMKLRVIKYTNLSQLYSIFKCNLLKEEYSLENNVFYDCVIKLRFDCFPNKKLICSKYDMNYLYYEEIGQPDNIISDWFNMGSNEIMNIYSSMFLNFKYLNNTKGFYKDRETCSLWDISKSMISPEYFIRDLMKKYQIPKKGIKINIEFFEGTFNK